MNVESPETGSARGQGDFPVARLRILETTDLHMQLLAYDYFADHIEDRTGLIQLADTIEELRSEDDVACLLFDNGDFLQGNPLADYVAANDAQDTTHPMIAALNALRYDAATLGNHEFNYGVKFLEAVLQDADFPVTCANIRRLHGDQLAEPYLLLDRELFCDDGQTRTIRIGVVGFVTPQIMDWDKAALAGEMEADDIVASARAIVPQIKAAGADIVVALCHSGIGATEHSPDMENAAVPLAAIQDVDVVLTGHTHEVFPDDGRPHSNAVDPVSGTLHDKPAVMAGFYGNMLGIVDLDLGRMEDTWRIVGQSVRLQPADPIPAKPSALQQRLVTLVAEPHAATLAHIRQPIAETTVQIHSYFATICPDMTQILLNRAQIAFISDVMADGPHADLPVISATAPFRCGGRAGPSHYIDIAPGPLALRDAAAIYPFTNTLCAVRRTGAQLRNWLERAASHFARIVPGKHDQPLINPWSPAYNCDTLFGLNYTFDLTQPARFAPDGTVADAAATRLCDLIHHGQPVADDDMFIVATNSYRTNGGGGFSRTPDEDVLFTSMEMTRDILSAYLEARGTIDVDETVIWNVLPIPDTSATFQSAPAAKQHISGPISHVGPGTDGFDLYRLML